MEVVHKHPAGRETEIKAHLPAVFFHAVLPLEIE